MGQMQWTGEGNACPVRVCDIRGLPTNAGRSGTLGGSFAAQVGQDVVVFLSLSLFLRKRWSWWCCGLPVRGCLVCRCCRQVSERSLFVRCNRRRAKADFSRASHGRLPAARHRRQASSLARQNGLQNPARQPAGVDDDADDELCSCHVIFTVLGHPIRPASGRKAILPSPLWP